MEKNTEIITDIVDMTNDGYGVGKIDGMAVFIPLTAVGDKVRALIVKVKKNYCFGKLLEIISPSEDRIIPDCAVFNRCGGCAYRHISYEAERKIKLNRIENAMRRIGNIDKNAADFLYNEQTDRYRNKAQYPVSQNGKCGFFAVHSHRIIECDDCKLGPYEFSFISEKFSSFISQNGISVYSDETKKGTVRHLYMRKAVATGEIMVVIVINGDELKNSEKLVNSLSANPNIKSIVLNINKDDTNVILGKKCKTLYGTDSITDILCGVKIRISPLSFYQVNHDTAEMLYKKVCEYAKPAGKTVLDLYCGTGTIGLSLADSVKKLIGVEIIEDAVRDARLNAEQNGFTNTEFICGDAAQAAKALKERKISPDVVIVDPPRKGCDETLLKIIAEDFKPETLVYVSCDPATLARDCAVLSALGYSVNEYTGVDMFPRTSHVETVVLLSRK